MSIVALLLAGCGSLLAGCGSNGSAPSGSGAHQTTGGTASGASGASGSGTGGAGGASGASGSETGGASRSGTGGASGTGADHDCIVGGGATPPPVAWTRLRNPILSEPDAAVKDQALVWSGGEWHMLFSYVTDDAPTPGAENWNIATATSSDLTQWSAPSPWPVQAGMDGVASPDIVRSPSGLFVATYDTNPDTAPDSPAQSKLYYRTSTDLETWSAPHPLAPGIHPAPGDRMIDAAVAWTGNGLILGYKYGTTSGSGAQHFEIAWSPSGSLDGPWTYVGRPDIVVNGDTIENFEFVAVAGRWHLVATSNSFDQPWIFVLSGDPSTPSSWLHSTGARMLVIPGQAWDSGPGISSVGYEHANSVFLCDARTGTADHSGTGTGDDSGAGYYYLTYAGSDELTHFGGWGHAKIGMARSTDLVQLADPGLTFRKRPTAKSAGRPITHRRETLTVSLPHRRARSNARGTGRPRLRATRAPLRTRRGRGGPALRPTCRRPAAARPRPPPL